MCDYFTNLILWGLFKVSEQKKLIDYLELIGYEISQPPEGGVIAIKGKLRFFIKCVEGLGEFDNGL